MIDAQELREALARLDSENEGCYSNADIDLVCDAGRLVLSVRVAEGEREAAGKACFGLWRDLTKTLSQAEIDEAWREKLNADARETWMKCGDAALLASALYRQREGKS